MNKSVNRSTIKTKFVNYFSVGMATLSLASLWVNGYVDAYHYKGEPGPMTVLFFSSAAFALLSGIICLVASIRTAGKKRYLYILCSIICAVVVALQVMSGLLINFL